MLDSKTFSQKPTSDETRGIQSRIKTSDVEIQLHELASQITKGCTFKPAWLSGSKSRDWIQQQLFALDFDNDVIYYDDKSKPVKIEDIKNINANDMLLGPEEISIKYGVTFKDNRTTIDEQLNKCKELNIYPAFGYTSFSHSDKKHKFRLVFCNNEVIEDPLYRCKLQYTLIKTFDKSDIVTFDATRLFYGGKTLICEDYSLIDGNKIVDTYYLSEYDMKVYRAASNIRPEIDDYKIFKGMKERQSLSQTDKINPPKQNSNRNITSKNITALRNRDSKHLKEALNYPVVKVENNAQYMDYICKIDLVELLEIDNPTSFNCLFHNDRNPCVCYSKNQPKIA